MGVVAKIPAIVEKVKDLIVLTLLLFVLVVGPAYVASLYGEGITDYLQPLRENVPFAVLILVSIVLYALSILTYAKLFQVLESGRESERPYILFYLIMAPLLTLSATSLVVGDVDWLSTLLWWACILMLVFVGLLIAALPILKVAKPY